MPFPIILWNFIIIETFLKFDLFDFFGGSGGPKIRWGDFWSKIFFSYFHAFSNHPVKFQNNWDIFEIWLIWLFWGVRGGQKSGGDFWSKNIFSLFIMPFPIILWNYRTIETFFKFDLFDFLLGVRGAEIQGGGNFWSKKYFFYFSCLFQSSCEFSEQLRHFLNLTFFGGSGGPKNRGGGIFGKKNCFPYFSCLFQSSCEISERLGHFWNLAYIDEISCQYPLKGM